MKLNQTVVADKAFQSLGVVERVLRKKLVLMTLIFINTFVFGLSLVINYMAGNPSKSFGLFHRTTGDIAREFSLNITPAGWAFSIWGVIYLLQAAWIIYSLTLICRTGDDDKPAYTSPMILSPTFFFFFITATISNAAWLVWWDRLLFTADLAFLVVIVTCLFMCLYISATRLAFFTPELIDAGRKWDVTFLQIVLLNGLGMYAAWSTVATHINLGVVLVYKWKLSTDETASFICVFILAAVAALFVVLDFLLCEKFTRFIFTPYLTIIWALSAILAKNWNPENKSSVASVTLVGAMTLAALIKVIYSFKKHETDPYDYKQMKVDKTPNDVN